MCRLKSEWGIKRLSQIPRKEVGLSAVGRGCGRDRFIGTAAAGGLTLPGRPDYLLLVVRTPHSCFAGNLRREA